jgi:hypothetical protein
MPLRKPRWAFVVALLFTNSFWYTFTLANHHRRHLVEDKPVVRRSQANATSPFPVLGIRNTGNDTVQPRLEIRELERRPDEFNVFLLGLQKFQSIDQNDKFSYYQVAGIVLEGADSRANSDALLILLRYSRRTFYSLGWRSVWSAEGRGLLQAQ